MPKSPLPRKNGSGGTTWLSGIGTKLVLLVVMPAILLGVLAIGAQQYAIGIGDQAVSNVVGNYENSIEISAATAAIQSNVNGFEEALVEFIEAHQGTLLKSKKASSREGLAKLKSLARELPSLVDRELTKVSETFHRPAMSSANEADILSEFDKRYRFIVRNAGNLPRLLEIFSESHERTVSLLDQGAFDRARANYIFEESARSRALQTSAARTTEVLEALVADAADRMVSNMQAAVDTAEETAQQAASRTIWLISIGVLLIACLGILTIVMIVIRPLGAATASMCKLADGNLDIEISGEGRRDELGDMAMALRHFKQNATAARDLQAEKEAQACAEMEEVEARRKSHDMFGAEIVALVEKVTDGDLTQRLSIDGKSGILADVCVNINKLVDGLDAVFSDVCNKMRALADGDLGQRVEADYRGAFGDLRDNVNRTAGQLADIVAQIRAVTGEVENAVAEISSGTSDLSERTEQAASNLEETAASTEQMAATVRQNADNAKNADQLADAANQTASRGGEIVERAVTAMSGIEGSAQKITDIIGVIDEIAFQTNLLALNASVEAARAGEAGKGFAVVAQEVRQLAQRSAQAADDIKSLIQDSNGQVKDGVELVNQAGEALGEIVGSIGKVTGIVREISSASQEQASGIQEINCSVTNMDEMTQQNSALVEESSAAARALSDQAGKLTELMTFFKLDGSATPYHRPPASSPRPRVSKPARTTPKAKPKQPVMRPDALADAGDDGWSEF